MKKVLFLFVLSIVSLSSLLTTQSSFAQNLSAPFLVVDIDGDGFEFIPLSESTVLFDVDGDGVKEHTAWIKPDEGLIAVSLHIYGDRKYTVEQRIFYMFTQGLDRLREYDTTHDGVVEKLVDDFPAFINYWQDLDNDKTPKNSEFSNRSGGKIKPLKSVAIAKSGIQQTIPDVGVVISDIGYVNTRSGDRLPFKEIRFFYSEDQR
ncbi:MAG: hypothetical protein KJ017_00510 [Alphaproteobacteria bacterium]|nr:hypothetical protein [Alphaproteobacteria bacterium]